MYLFFAATINPFQKNYISSSIFKNFVPGPFVSHFTVKHVSQIRVFLRNLYCRIDIAVSVCEKTV